jgi:hypothetical protein
VWGVAVPRPIIGLAAALRESRERLGVLRRAEHITQSVTKLTFLTIDWTEAQGYTTTRITASPNNDTHPLSAFIVPSRFFVHIFDMTTKGGEPHEAKDRCRDPRRPPCALGHWWRVRRQPRTKSSAAKVRAGIDTRLLREVMVGKAGR